MRTYAIAALGLLLFLIVSGCGSTAGSGNEHAGHAGHAANGLPDNITVTASGSELPAFLDNYTETARTLYANAFKYQDVLKELNCYCGCMEYDDPHDSLLRCFIAGTDAEGVHWTDHGGSCGVCMMEVRDAVDMAEKGSSVADIRAHIDSTYGGGSAS